MKLTISILFFLIFIPLQDDYPVIKLKGKPEIFAADPFNQVYVYMNGILEKYNQEGKLCSRFSSSEFGKISSIDVSDPLQIAIFYKDFNTIQFLDKNLNLVGQPVKLDDIGFHSIDAVCKSKQFGLWLYDSYAQQIILYGFNPKGVQAEIDLLKHSKPLGSIDYIQEYGDKLYLHRKGMAVWVFDLSLQQLGILSIENVNNFQIKNDNLYYTMNGKLIRYNKETETGDTINISEIKQADDIQLGNQKAFVLNSDSISIITIDVH